MVRKELVSSTKRALKNLRKAEIFSIGKPVKIKLKFSSTTQAEVLLAIPGIKRVDGYTVSYIAEDMKQAYALIRLMYKYVKP